MTKDVGLTVDNKERMGRRTRATTKKMTTGASSEIKQIKAIIEKMDVLWEKATKMMKIIG